MGWDPNPPDGLKYVQRHYGKYVELESKDPLKDTFRYIMVYPDFRRYGQNTKSTVREIPGY